jgi:hypothetical protein
MCVERCRKRALDRTEWASVVRVARDKLKGAAVLQKKNPFSTRNSFKYQ